MLDKKQNRMGNMLIFTLCIIFALSISIKMVYSSVLINIQEEYNLNNSLTTLGLPIYYAVYATCQILFAVFIKKFNVKKLFFWSIILTGITYSLIIFAKDIWILWAIMAINGIVQTPHWAGCVYFASKFLRGKKLFQANSAIAISNPLGTALSIGICALFVYLNMWKMAFLFLGILLVVFAFIFKFVENQSEKYLVYPEEKKEEKEQEGRPVFTKKQMKIAIFTVVIFGVCNLFVMGAASSIKALLPKLYFEVHELDKSLSTLLPILLPTIAMILKIVVFDICRKKNYHTVSVVIDLISLSMLVVLYFTFKSSLILTIFLPMAIYACLSTISGLHASFFAISARKKINAGSTSAIVNALGSLGTGFMPFVSGVLLDAGGNAAWNNMFIFTIALTCASLIIFTVVVLTKKKNPLIYDD